MLYKTDDMEPCEIVSNTVSHPSSSVQHGPEHCNKDVDEELQLKALMKRLTLEESLFITDQPINYCIRYSNQETENSCYFTEDTDKLNTYCPENPSCNFPTGDSFSDLLSSDSNSLFIESKNVKSSSLSVGNDNCIVNMPIPNQNKPETEEGELIKFETPLMYSRCSSLDSLSSCEPLNDGSSVISEFSQVTSGLVSPSELPDSPTQTMPNSINPFVISEKVFKDQVSEFKKDSIPINRCKVTNPNNFTFGKELLEPMAKGKYHLPKEPRPYKTNELTLVDEDEDILAACIRDGIQSSLHNYHKSMVMKNTRIGCVPIQQADEISTNIEVPVKSDMTLKIPYLEGLGDSVTVYHTEGTPSISNHTSRRDSSNMCVLSNDADCNKTITACRRSDLFKVQPR